MFQRWAGISPKRFLQHAIAADARALLRRSQSVLDVSLAVGLSGPGRLHDLVLRVDRMTPGELKGGLPVDWAVLATPLGEALMAATSRGLCAVQFVEPGDDAAAALAARFPRATLRRAPARLRPYAEELSRRLRGRAPRPLALALAGTPFQLKVWEALVRIPDGRVSDYAQVAAAIGAPGAHRAVAQAIAHNPIAYLIPCHRVIRVTGAFGGYRWGATRKRALLAVEQAR